MADDYDLSNAEHMTNDMTETVGSNKLTTFDAVNALTPHAIAAIRKRGENMLAGPELCREIWIDLRKTDLTLKGIVNFITFESIYEKYKERICKVLDFINCKDLYDLLDDDNDGF